MADQAQIEKYDELISALQKFNGTIWQSMQNMQDCGQACMTAMGSDQLSVNAVTKLNSEIARYQEVIDKSTRLISKLSQERNNIQRLIAESRM